MKKSTNFTNYIEGIFLWFELKQINLLDIMFVMQIVAPRKIILKNFILQICHSVFT